MTTGKKKSKYFHSNFKFMLKKIGCTLYDIEMDSQNSVGCNLAPSSSTLYRCQNENYFPSISTVNKLVAFYNANLMPPIDVDTFLNQDLEKLDVGKNKELIVDRIFQGDYYCYYLSDNYLEKIHFGILRVYEQNKSLRAHLILGLKEQEQVHDLFSKLFNRGISYTGFNYWRSNLPTQLQRCYYCEGKVRIFPDSMVMELENENTPGHLMYLTFNLDNYTAVEKYMGGMGIYLSPAIGRLETRVCQIAIQRKSRHNFPLNLDKLKGYLKMNLTEYHRYELTATQDRKFNNYFL